VFEPAAPRPPEEKLGILDRHPARAGFFIKLMEGIFLKE
jgi:hypothetical protein